MQLDSLCLHVIHQILLGSLCFFDVLEFCSEQNLKIVGFIMYSSLVKL